MAPADEPDVRPDLHAADGELLSRIAGRDVDAFAVLYGRYVRSVFGLALRRLHDRREAERATEDAFAAIWRAAATSVPLHDSGARWLFAVAENTIIDHSRRAVGGREFRPEPEPDDAWSAFRLHAALAELSEPERVALELAYWEGRSPSEIGKLLDVPVGLVELRLRSALAHLAVTLEGSDEQSRANPTP